MSSRIYSLWRRPAAHAGVIRHQGGASAIEFALLAPVLVMACLATVDVGMAISQRMDMDQILRAGSEAAMVDLGEEEVKTYVEDAASQSFKVAPEPGEGGDIGTASPSDLDVSVKRFCSCPGTGNAAADCDEPACPGGVEPYVFYRLTAEKTYEPMFLPDFGLRGSMLVQVE